MRFSHHQERLQAVLFASGEPLELSRAAAAAELTVDETKDAIREINRFYQTHGLPFELAILGDQVQMCTLPEHADVIRETLAQGRSIPLSQAAMETLAIVAYNQPVTKAFVEQVRGVDSSGVMNSLMNRQLIEEADRLELPGRPIAYRTTAHFLRCFSLASLEELPSVSAEEETEAAE